MQAVVIRPELSPEAAKILLGLASQFAVDVDRRLEGVVPVHTKAALEKQSADAHESIRALELASANPVEVEVPDPPGFSA